MVYSIEHNDNNKALDTHIKNSLYYGPMKLMLGHPEHPPRYQYTRVCFTNWSDRTMNAGASYLAILNILLTGYSGHIGGIKTNY